MSALSGLVRKELRRYSQALGKALASFETRPELQNADELGGILAEVHALFEDDFLDRLEPSGWIQPLFEHSLVPLAVQLMAFILHTHQQAKEFGLLSPTTTLSSKSRVVDPDGDVAEQQQLQPKPSILTQLAAVQVGQAAFPIQWAAQAIQLESSSAQPPSQRLGPRLFEELTSDAALYAMAGAARLVQKDLWGNQAPNQTPGPAASSCPGEPDADHTEDSPEDDASEAAAADSSAINLNGAVAIIQATLRRGKSAGSGPANSIGGGLFRRVTAVTEGDFAAAGGVGVAGSTALVGVRLLSIVVNYVSTALATAQEQTPPKKSSSSSKTPEPATAAAGEDAAASAGDTAVDAGPAADADTDATADAAPPVPPTQRLLEAMHASGILGALCGAVLAAPPCPSSATAASADATASVVDDYVQLLSEIQLTLFMLLWDLSALLAAPYGKVAAELLATPEVVQLRRETLLQVAASALAVADVAPGGDTHAALTASSIAVAGDGRAAAAGSDGGAVASSGDGGGGGAPTVTCWPLLRCQTVRRIYAAKGLQFADVVHIMVDAAVGAVVVPQDLGADGAAAAAVAAKQLFPSPLAAAELAVRVCRSLCQHSERLASEQAKAARAGKYTTGGGSAAAAAAAAARAQPNAPPQSFRGPGVSLPTRQEPQLTQQQYLQQREQLADDAASVEAAIRVCVAAATPAEAAACHPAVAAVRKWVLQAAAAARAPLPSLPAEAEAAAGLEEQHGETQGVVAMTLADGGEITARPGSSTGRREGAKRSGSSRISSPPAAAASPPPAGSTSASPIRGAAAVDPQTARAGATWDPRRSQNLSATAAATTTAVATTATAAGPAINSTTPGGSARDQDAVLSGSPQLSTGSRSDGSICPLPTLRDPVPCIMAAPPPPPSPDRAEEPAEPAGGADGADNKEGGSQEGVAAEAEGPAAGGSSPVAGPGPREGKKRVKLLPRGLRHSLDRLKRWVASRSPERTRS